MRAAGVLPPCSGIQADISVRPLDILAISDMATVLLSGADDTAGICRTRMVPLDEMRFERGIVPEIEEPQPTTRWGKLLATIF